MGEKQNAYLNIGLLCAIILILMTVDLLNSDRVYSETENRVLAKKPEFSKEALLEGSYTEDYEEYITDQFVSRDKWVSIKTYFEVLTGKTLINGVYLGADDYLIQEHTEEDFTEEQIQEKLTLLDKLVTKWDAQVMLVPTADNILSEKLPSYAPYYDQRVLLERVKQLVGEENYIDVYSVLDAHDEEYIYYRTDHHWSTLGAYYGYRAWAQHMGVSEYDYDLSQRTAVTKEFQGTLQAKINIGGRTDTIYAFPSSTWKKPYIVFDGAAKGNSYYSEKYLDTKNQYGYFLDDNHGTIEIDTGYDTGKVLFLIKDSYANCMVPLLAPHYNKIFVLDLRYYNGKLDTLINSWEHVHEMDVLVLYNCVHFLEDFKYYE